MRPWHASARLVAAVAAAGAAAVSCGGPGRPAVSTSVATTTTAATCAPFGSTGPASGPPVGAPPVALLRNVQVQASACVDEVSFLFLAGTPAWTAGYQDGPLALDPSGLPAEVPGGSHLVVGFAHASGVDLSVTPPRQSYDGPTEMTPGAPSGVAGVVRLGDFEAVTTWAVGMPRSRPFQVVTRNDQVVLRVPAASPRDTRCVAPGSPLSVGYPPDWYTELSPRWACRYFDPAPFVVHSATDAVSWAVTAQEADAPSSTVVARIAEGATIVSRTARIVGLEATVVDVTESGRGMYPAGYRYPVYVVATSPDAFVVSSRPSPPGAAAERGLSAVDRVAALLRPA